MMSFFTDKEHKARLIHICAGLVVLVHSYDRHEEHHSYILFLVAGTLMLLLALFHPIIENKQPWIVGIFFLIEGILSFYLAYDYYSLGKKALPFTYVCLGVFQFVMSRKRIRKQMKNYVSIQEDAKHLQ